MGVGDAFFVECHTASAHITAGTNVMQDNFGCVFPLLAFRYDASTASRLLKQLPQPMLCFCAQSSSGSNE